MADQCMFCEHYEKFEDCIKEDCFKHEDFIVVELSGRLAAAEKEISEKWILIAHMSETNYKHEERIEDLESERDSFRKVLEEIQSYNRLSNDLDAYLYDLCEYALGEITEKPNPKDFGL